MKTILMMLNIVDKSILVISQAYKNILEKIRNGSLIKQSITLLVFQTEIHPLACGKYIKLPKEGDHPRKDLINILMWWCNKETFKQWNCNGWKR